jgi:anaerobic magnesium-protoporphyrin IX monomethyl ester cyclase
MRVAVADPCLEVRTNVIRDVIYGCWCGGKRIGGATIPPFVQLTIATLLQQDGHEVVFVDAQAEQLSLDEVACRIAGAALVVVSTSVMTVRGDAAFVLALKDRLPGLEAAAYGSHPTFLPEDTLNKGIDYAVQHEPEGVVRKLAATLATGDRAAARRIAGIVARDENGSLIRNPRHPFIEDLNQIPPLNIDFLPKGVVYFNPIVRNLPYIAVSTSHGCPAKCSYCTAPFFHGTRTRFMSAAKVVEDIATYLGRGIGEIYFRDETFTADRQRVLDICRGITEGGLRFSWICNSRVDTLDQEMVLAMRQAGCHLIKFGTESGNQSVLDASKKGISLEQTRQAFHWCRKAGIDTHAHFMVGMPGETLETLDETLNFALEIDPTTVTFGICTPYPGTPLFREVTRKDASIGDGSDNAAMESLHVQGRFNHLFCAVDSETLARTVTRNYRRFYLRPGYLLKALLRIRTSTMLRNAVIGGLNVLSFSLSKRGG